MKGKLLVVDDDEGLQRAIRRAAETAGFDVTQVFDGFEALELLAAETFDVILLDINMPAMDGRDVLTHLKRDSRTADIPVIVHSSRGSQLDRHLLFELGADEFIEKPAELRLLVGKLGHLVERARSRREP